MLTMYIFSVFFIAIYIIAVKINLSISSNDQKEDLPDKILSKVGIYCPIINVLYAISGSCFLVQAMKELAKETQRFAKNAKPVAKMLLRDKGMIHALFKKSMFTESEIKHSFPLRFLYKYFGGRVDYLSVDVT